MGMGSVCDTILSFIRKFFSLILALLIIATSFIYVVGACIIISKDKSFGNSGFAHFLGVLAAILTAIGYIALHFVPRKAYRLLYGLTFMFLVSMFLLAHSLGLSAPTVTDCNADVSYLNLSWEDWTNIGHVAQGNDSTIIGSMGQKVTQCGANGALFAGAFMTLILYIIALFDVQTVLLTRVKSKTYGERFVEMGISS